MGINNFIKICKKTGQWCFTAIILDDRAMITNPSSINNNRISGLIQSNHFNFYLKKRATACNATANL